MKTNRTWLGALAIMLAITATPAAAQSLADGNDWMRSSEDERKAYLVGVSNMISVGVAYDRRHSPDHTGSFSLRAFENLGDSSIPNAMRVVDRHYRDNPGELDKPILSVIWTQIGQDGEDR